MVKISIVKDNLKEKVVSFLQGKEQKANISFKKENNVVKVL